MAKSKNRITPTMDRLRRYADGALSPAEQHQLEKAALLNQQLEDTLEGLQAMKAAGIEEKVVLADLSQRLRQRVRPKERRLIPYYYASAAAVVLTVGLSWWVIRKEKLSVENKETSAMIKELATPILQPEKTPPAPESPSKLPEAPSTTVPKPSVSIPIPAPEKRAEAGQQPEPAVAALIVEENKNESEAPASIPQATQPQEDAPPPVAAKAKMPAQNRVAASAPAGAVQSFKKETAFTLRGIVLDAATLLPVPGAVLSLEQQNKGASTDTEGKFTLPDVRKNEKITVAAIGFQSVQMSVKDSIVSPVLLKEDKQVLSEVVVTDSRKNKPASKEASPVSGYKNYEHYLKTSAAAFVARHPEGPRGKVVLQFSVTSSGELTDFENKNKANPVLFEEAVRMVKAGERWQPLLKNGQTKAEKVRLTIRFE
ncbi:MAG: carboxypeptidase-like regulatory domain-containing protein [Spirosomataceae bacterium]